MDPITTSLIIATAAGIVKGTTKIAEQAVLDAYNFVKELLKRKFGSQSEVVKAVDGLEAKPDSTARRELLREELAAIKADQDDELSTAVKNLQDKLGMGNTASIVQQATGQYIALAGQNSTASVNVNQPKSE